MNIKQFLKKEDGFLGALAGAAVGGLFGGGSGKALATAVGKGFGAQYDRRKAEGRQREWEAGNIQRTVNEARAAGIHPLEAIRGGGLSDHSPSGPNLGTSAAMANQFDQIDAILTGRDAQKDRLRESQIELNRIEADQMRRGVQANNAFPGTSRKTTRSPVSTGVATNVVEATQYGGEGVMPHDETGRPLSSDADDPSHTDYNPTAAPRMRIFGQDLVGSGNISSGQTVEDAAGEGPMQWLMSPLIYADMIGATLGRARNKSRIERETMESVHTSTKKPKASRRNGRKK